MKVDKTTKITLSVRSGAKRNGDTESSLKTRRASAVFAVFAAEHSASCKYGATRSVRAGFCVFTPLRSIPFRYATLHYAAFRYAQKGSCFCMPGLGAVVLSGFRGLVNSCI